MKALITGASGGIGLEVAKILAAKGYEATLVARNKEKLEKVLAELPGSSHHFFVADLSQKKEVDALKENIETNSYDVFINNAGVGMYGRFIEMPLSEQVKMINLNVIAVTALSYFYLNHAKKGDALVNVSSTLGTSSFPGQAAYSGTKAYVTHFSESLWGENKKCGVFVMGFCPGVTHTDFHTNANGSDEGYPKFIIQTASEAAAELVSALENRSQPRVVSGFMNRFMLSFQRLLSRKMVVSMMGSFSPVKF
jgi:short-subunit dehydrogenase